MAKINDYFHVWRKATAESWVKRLNKAGFVASYKAVTDSNGNVGHGPGNMGYELHVEGESEDWRTFHRSCLDLEPKSRR